jgi:hypothetical protein
MILDVPLGETQAAQAIEAAVTDLTTRVSLWTMDKQLRKMALALGVALGS